MYQLGRQLFQTNLGEAWAGTCLLPEGRAVWGGGHQLRTPWVKPATLPAELMFHGYPHTRHKAAPQERFHCAREVPLEGKAISEAMNQNSVFSSFVKEPGFLALAKPWAQIIAAGT